MIDDDVEEEDDKGMMIVMIHSTICHCNLPFASVEVASIPQPKTITCLYIFNVYNHLFIQ